MWCKLQRSRVGVEVAAVARLRNSLQVIEIERTVSTDARGKRVILAQKRWRSSIQQLIVLGSSRKLVVIPVASRAAGLTEAVVHALFERVGPDAVVSCVAQVLVDLGEGVRERESE